MKGKSEAQAGWELCKTVWTVYSTNYHLCDNSSVTQQITGCKSRGMQNDLRPLQYTILPLV